MGAVSTSHSRDRLARSRLIAEGASPAASFSARRFPGALLADSARTRASTRAALGLILIATFALRLSAVGFGNRALTFQPDEDSNVPIALGLSWLHLNPHAFYYPDLVWYLLFGINRGVFWLLRQFGVVGGWAQYRSLFDQDPLPFFLIGRALSVVFGTAAVALLYLLGRRLRSRAHGLLAAGLLAASFLHVRDSALATPEAAMSFFVLLSLVGAVGVVHHGRWRDYAIAAVGAGLATAAKYNAVLVLAALVVGHGIREVQGGRSLRRAAAAPRVLMALGLAALVFLVLNPYLLLDWPEARKGLAWQWSYSQTGQYLDIGPAWLYHLTVSLRYGMGWLLLGLGIAGLARAAWRREPGELAVLSFVVVFFAEMGTLRAIFVRYMTPLVPVLCLFAASAMLAVTERIRPPRARAWALAALAALAVLEPLHSSLAYARLVRHVDTRVQTYEFLRTVPRGLRAATYGPSVVWRSTLPRWRPTFYAKSPGQSWAEVLAILKSRGIHYVLIHHSALDVFSPPMPELEAEVERAGTLIREFSPYAPGSDPHPMYDRVDAHYFPIGAFGGVVRPGPLVRVYQLHGDGVASARD